jgi:hypothetical protein
MKFQIFLGWIAKNDSVLVLLLLTKIIITVKRRNSEIG